MRRADLKSVDSTSPTALQKLEFKVVLGGHGRCMAAFNNSTGFELNMERNCRLFHSVRDLTLNLKNPPRHRFFAGGTLSRISSSNSDYRWYQKLDGAARHHNGACPRTLVIPCCVSNMGKCARALPVGEGWFKLMAKCHRL